MEEEDYNKNINQEITTQNNFHKFSIKNDFKNQITITPIIAKRNIFNHSNNILMKEIIKKKSENIL